MNLHLLSSNLAFYSKGRNQERQLHIDGMEYMTEIECDTDGRCRDMFWDFVYIIVIPGGILFIIIFITSVLMCCSSCKRLSSDILLWTFYSPYFFSFGIINLLNIIHVLTFFMVTSVKLHFRYLLKSYTCTTIYRGNSTISMFAYPLLSNSCFLFFWYFIFQEKRRHHNR